MVLNSVVFPSNDYNNAIEKIQNGNYEEGWAELEELGDYKDSVKILQESKYNVAVKMEEEKDYAKAAMLYGYDAGYKDAKEKSMECWKKVDSVKSTISAGDDYSVAVKKDGSVVACGSNNKDQCDVEGWENIIAVCANDEHTLGLKMDGTVVSVGKSKYGKCDVEDWDNIISIASGFKHSVGLRADGTVVAVGDNKHGQCDVEDWKDIVFITAFANKTVGIKSDGTVLINGYNTEQEANKINRMDEGVLQIAISDNYIYVLDENGNVKYSSGKIVKGFDGEHVVCIKAGTNNIAGIKEDGSVVVSGIHDLDYATTWEDIVDVSLYRDHIIGLKKDGSVVAEGNNDKGQCDVDSWDNILIW